MCKLYQYFALYHAQIYLYYAFYRYNLGESQMIVLAGIIKDLDRETSRTDSGMYF